ncbi:MAG: FtsX-like permease family protein [Thermoplasmata archaeon]|nr:MAG: FtsX-like permease family protein [Thermoplasmata archaeon]
MDFAVLLTVIFAVVLTAILLSGARNRITFKMGMRNIWRRKVNTVIILSGLMVGTIIISSSFVVRDTMNEFVTDSVYDTYYMDDVVLVGKAVNGEEVYFNQEVMDDVEAVCGKNADGGRGYIKDEVSLSHPAASLFEPVVTINGVGYETSSAFGPFVSNGNEVEISSNELWVGENLAEDLDITSGSLVIIYAMGAQHNMLVTGILDAEGRTEDGNGIFVALETAQTMLNEPGRINMIAISNPGGVRDSVGEEQVIDAIDEADLKDGSITIEVLSSKKADIELEKEAAEGFTSIFLFLGVFSIITGVILIINIFVMLGEERKSEMGMARALGMRQKVLRKLYLYEGTGYAVFASFLGAIIGIGVGYGVMYFISEFMTSPQPGVQWSLLEHFTYTADGLITAFVMGFFITLTTIIITSSRISKINIIRAVRNIPEPPIDKGSKKMFRTGFVLIILGALLALMAYSAGGPGTMALFAGGITSIIFGTGLILRRYVGDRIAMTLAGIVVLVMLSLPFEAWPGHLVGDMDMFILGGMFRILSALMVIMFNSDYVVKFISFIAGKGKNGRKALVKIAISYPLTSKFRTGMTVAMFALIIFVITIMQVMVGMFSYNIDAQIDEVSGGYHIIGNTISDTPIIMLEETIEQNELLAPEVVGFFAPISGNAIIETPDYPDEQPFPNQFVGFDNDSLENSPFKLKTYMDSYPNGEAVWRELMVNESVVVADSSLAYDEYAMEITGYLLLGDKINVLTKTGSYENLTIIGFMDSFVIRGIIQHESLVKDAGIYGSSQILIKVRDEGKSSEVAKELEKAFLANGLQTIVIRETMEEQLGAMNQFFDLFQAYMSIGLIVGIAGLGIIIIRAVTERFKEIGMIRAIGFKRKMVLSSFLIESTFVAVLGILIGVSLGVVSGYSFWLEDFKEIGWSFYLPWGEIALVGFMALAVSLLCTIPPSYKASKISPAEALRYE